MTMTISEAEYLKKRVEMLERENRFLREALAYSAKRLLEKLSGVFYT
jgi:hypothetical protein